MQPGTTVYHFVPRQRPICGECRLTDVTFKISGTRVRPEMCSQYSHGNEHPMTLDTFERLLARVSSNVLF